MKNKVEENYGLPEKAVNIYVILYLKATVERGQINFPNHASQLQAILVRSKSAKTLK